MKIYQIRKIIICNRIRNSYLPELEKKNPRFRDAILRIGNEILDYDLAIAELSNNIDVENVEQLFSYSESTQRVLLNLSESFSRFESYKAQFKEVRQILKTKSQYRNPLKMVMN